MTDTTDEWRKKRLCDAAAKAGGDAALGRMLGYQSGAHVAQMKRGMRPITEKTVDRIEALRGYANWFRNDAAAEEEELVARSPSAPYYAGPAVTIAQAVDTIANALNALPADQVDAVAERLKTLALAPDSQKARAAVISLLSGEILPTAVGQN